MTEFVLPDAHAEAFALESAMINEVSKQAFETLVWSENVPDDAHIDSSVVTAVHLVVADFLSNLSVQEKIAELGLEPSFLGHNLILSGNHHGTGFWDTHLSREDGDLLHAYSIGVEIYNGDDGAWYA